MPFGIIAATDGVSESYPEDYFLNSICCPYISEFRSSYNDALSDLVEFLRDTTGKSSSKDDVSMAGIYFVNTEAEEVAEVPGNDSCEVSAETSTADEDLSENEPENDAPIVKLDYTRKYVKSKPD